MVSSLWLSLKQHLWSGLGLPRCNHLTYLASQAMDRKLSLKERMLLGSHYVICGQCVLYREQLEVMRHSLRTKEPGTTSIDSSLSPETRDRIKSLLSNHGDRRSELRG